MGAKLRVEVAQDSDADRVAHRPILIEKTSGAVYSPVKEIGGQVRGLDSRFP